MARQQIVVPNTTPAYILRAWEDGADRLPIVAWAIDRDDVSSEPEGSVFPRPLFFSVLDDGYFVDLLMFQQRWQDLHTGETYTSEQQAFAASRAFLIARRARASKA